MVSIYKEVCVDCDLDDFDDEDLFREIEERGLNLDSLSVEAASDEQLIQELEGRGLIVVSKHDYVDFENQIHDLFYDLVSGRHVGQSLQRFFKQAINEYI